MRLISEKIEFRSKKSKDEILENLSLSIGRLGQFGTTFNQGLERDFEGEVSNKGFKVRRVLKSGINSFIPIGEGTLKSEKDETLISVHIRLNKYVRAFLFVFVGFGLLMFLTPFKGFSNLDWSELTMSLIALGFASIMFNMESERLKTWMRNQFEE